MNELSRGEKAIQEGEYISKHLIHWTGKERVAKGAEILEKIVESCELLLNYNPIHKPDIYTEIHEKMVCFTDVPLIHSERHCSRYGRFGIAFKKLALIGVGAQPVFYAAPPFKEDLDKIFKFLGKQSKARTLDMKIFRALQKHFFYMQKFSEGRADSSDSHYYEREWRLGSMTLATAEERVQLNAIELKEKYGRYIGTRVIHSDGKEYFSFKKTDVAFLIVPKNYQERIKSVCQFEIYTIEDFQNNSKTRGC